MTIYGDDLLYGDYFRASNFGLVLGSFDGSVNGDEDTMLAAKTNSVFAGGSSSIFLSQTYEENLELEACFLKNPCLYADEPYFTEHDLRAVARVLEGQKGYQWMKVLSDGVDNGENDIWYYCRTSNIAYHKIGGGVVGLKVTFECNGSRAYGPEQTITVDAKNAEWWTLYNDTDELWQYTLPKVSIKISSSPQYTTLQINHNAGSTKISSIAAGEEITMDSRYSILKSSRSSNIMNLFNFSWIKLIPGENRIRCYPDMTISFTYRPIRKVGGYT